MTDSATMDVTKFTDYIRHNVAPDLWAGTIANVNTWLSSGKQAAVYADSTRSMSDLVNPACILVSFGSSNSMLGDTSAPPTTLPNNNHYRLVGTYSGPTISSDSIG